MESMVCDFPRDRRNVDYLMDGGLRIYLIIGQRSGVNYFYRSTTTIFTDCDQVEVRYRSGRRNTRTIYWSHTLYYLWHTLSQVEPYRVSYALGVSPRRRTSHGVAYRTRPAPGREHQEAHQPSGCTVGLQGRSADLPGCTGDPQGWPANPPGWSAALP